MIESPVTEKTSLQQPAWFTLLRIALGLVLFWKGITFIRDTAFLDALIRQTGVGIFTRYSGMLSFVVAYLSLLCGLFIFSGFYTRTACIVQIPILLIAVIFVNMKQIDISRFEFILSIVVLLLLVWFAFKGSGTISADEFFRTYYKAGTEDGHTGRFFKSRQ